MNEDEKSGNFFITAGMDNKIHMTKDNGFGENISMKTIELRDAMVSTVIYYPDPKCKFIVVGTTSGVILFYESETSKLHRISQDG